MKQANSLRKTAKDKIQEQAAYRCKLKYQGQCLYNKIKWEQSKSLLEEIDEIKTRKRRICGFWYEVSQ